MSDCADRDGDDDGVGGDPRANGTTEADVSATARDNGAISQERPGNKDHEGMVDIPVDNHISDGIQLPGNVVVTKNADLSERMQNFKSWGVTTFMRTRQKVKEKLSRASRTVDVGLEDQIALLRTQKIQYGMLVAHNRRVMDQLRQLILIHQYGGRVATEIGQTERALAESFLGQSQLETASVAAINELIGKLAVSNETIETLVSKTFDDMLATIDSYENARIEFDAYKTETERMVTNIELQQQKKAANATAAEEARLQQMRDSVEQRRAKYESYKSDVMVKIDLLEDHKNRVVQREMANCRNAWCHYYSQCAELLSDSSRSPLHRRQSPVGDDDRQEMAADHKDQ